MPDQHEAEHRARYPLGAAVTVAELTADPHPALRRLRESEPVSWLPATGGWLVTRADLTEPVLREPAAFTVDDPRFTTARVVGPSMLSLDGTEHRRHRDPFARALRSGDTRARLAEAAQRKAQFLVAALTTAGNEAELRRGLAGQLAVAVMAEMLGLQVAPAQLLTWYDAIVAGVSALSVANGPVTPGRSVAAPTAGGPVADEPAIGGADADQAAVAAGQLPGGESARGDGTGRSGKIGRGEGTGRRWNTSGGDEIVRAAEAAFAELSASVTAALARRGDRSVLTEAAESLPLAEVVSNAAVLLFGGIETTEGMIGNAVWYLLRDPDAVREVNADRTLVDAVVEESLRLEPAAAVVDRYATADITLGTASIRRGDLVTVSLAGANRDPQVFADPDRFDLHRPNGSRHWAFAVGPHFCIGAQLARLEATAAVGALLEQLPGLRLDPGRPSSPQGLVFRKPPSLHVQWDS